MYNLASVLEIDTETTMGLLHTNGSPNLHPMTRTYNNQQKRICIIVDFAVSAEHRVKSKEMAKKKYLDFARKLKKLWNMKEMIIPIVSCALGTVTNRLIQRMEDLEITGWVETNKTTPLRSARIHGRLLQIFEDLLSLRIQR